MEQEGMTSWQRRFINIATDIGVGCLIAVCILAVPAIVKTVNDDSGMPVSRLQSGTSKTASGETVTEYYDREQGRRWWVTESGEVLDCGASMDSEIKMHEGCPLDAVAYHSPAFAGNDGPLYKVTDRISGEQWWLFMMNGEIVSLPIGEP